jgi:ceramide glucosyltransferase
MTIALSIWCALALGFTVTAIIKTRRPANENRTARANVILLRPVDAPTTLELNTLANVPAGVEQWVLSPTKPQGSAGRWVASNPQTLNRKLGHLQNAIAQLEGDQPVLAIDADVQVDGSLVDALLAGLKSGAALAWAAPAPEATGLERGLLVQSAHSFEVLAAMSPGSSPLCGKAMALSPQALAVLRELPDCVGEDLQLSDELHSHGLTTRLVGRAHIPGMRSVRDSLHRFTRWMQVLRAHRTALFPTIPFFFACTPMLLLASLFVQWPVQVLIIALFFTRALLAWKQEGRPSMWWLAGETLLLASWLRSLWLGTRVTWRGRVMQLGPAGVLREATR